MKIDLHSHTKRSDGELSPEELINRAHNQGVDVLAITDHDTVQAIAEAQQIIDDKQYNIQLISGVEISTSWDGCEIHIVGLNVDHECPQFLQRLNQQLETRLDRAQRIAKKLAIKGMENTYDGAAELATSDCISRAHFARHLMLEGHVQTMDEAFKKFLARRKSCYVAPGWITVEQAIDWIHDAGGQAVLAHPTRYDLSNKWVRKLIAYFAEQGGDAIEVALSRQSPNERIQLQSYADNHQLLSSIGSDFHRVSRFAELGKNLTLPSAAKPVWQDWALMANANHGTN